jgi:uncharacterized protein YciI
MDYARPMRYPGASKCKRTSTKDPQMLILSLTYLKANEEADRYMEPHMAWVKEGYERGWFLASGRKVPRTGGLILSAGDRAELEAYVAADPFTVHGIARYDITEVAITTVVEGLEKLKD